MAAEQRHSEEPICAKHKLKRWGMSAFRSARSNGSALLSLWSDTILCLCENGSKHERAPYRETSSGCKQSVPTKKNQKQNSVIEKLQGFTSVRHDRLVLARSFRMTSLRKDGDWTVLGHWKNSHLN